MERRSKEKIIPYEIYTDGSLKKLGDAYFGGWAFLIIRDGRFLYEKSGSLFMTTNQRMELTAVLNALHFIQNIRKEHDKVIIYSDSAYLVNCYLKEWYINWLANGWVNANKKPVANQDLWNEIIPYFDNFWYTFRKVEAHAGNIWNEKCDEQAQFEAAQLLKNWRGKNE